MAGPSWLAGVFAAVMILTAGYSASRLAVSRLRGLATEADADGLHAVMGTAMAGMLVPQLNLLPATAWMVVFGTGAAWFGACAIRSRSQARFSWQCRYPVPHLIECVAMLYMLLAVRGAQQGPGMAMPGMGTSPGTPAGFPALAASPGPVHARLHHVDHRPAGFPGPGQDHHSQPARPRSSGRWSPSQSAGRPTSMASAGHTRHRRMPRQDATASQALLAPKLAAFGKIAMGITMGYMLILML